MDPPELASEPPRSRIELRAAFKSIGWGNVRDLTRPSICFPKSPIPIMRGGVIKLNHVKVQKERSPRLHFLIQIGEEWESSTWDASDMKLNKAFFFFPPFPTEIVRTGGKSASNNAEYCIFSMQVRRRVGSTWRCDCGCSQPL
jgi:hypothetical protein